MMKSQQQPPISDYDFGKLSAFEAVGRAFSIVFSNLCTFLTIGLVQVPLLMLAVFMMVVLNGNQQSGENLSAGTIVALILLSVLVVVASLVGQGASIRATAEIYAGGDPSVTKCLQEGVRNVCRLFCFGLVLMLPLLGLVLIGVVFVGIVALANGGSGDDNQLSTAAILLAMVLLPVWFTVYVYIMIPFQMAPPSLVLESVTVASVVKRAWELTSGDRCTVFLATFLLSLINQIIGMVPLLGLFWVFVSVQLVSVLVTILFLSFRAEKEGLTQEILCNELGYNMLDDGTELCTDVIAVSDMDKGVPAGYSNPKETEFSKEFV